MVHQHGGKYHRHDRRERGRRMELRRLEGGPKRQLSSLHPGRGHLQFEGRALPVPAGYGSGGEGRGGTGAPGKKKDDDESTTMKPKTERVKPLSEREVQAFLNDDRELSEQGSIQWQRNGIWRWVSSDGLAFAASDGRTVDIGRTANGEIKTVLLPH